MLLNLLRTPFTFDVFYYCFCYCIEKFIFVCFTFLLFYFAHAFYSWVASLWLLHKKSCAVVLVTGHFIAFECNLTRQPFQEWQEWLRFFVWRQELWTKLLANKALPNHLWEHIEACVNNLRRDFCHEYVWNACYWTICEMTFSSTSNLWEEVSKLAWHQWSTVDCAQ